MPQPLQVQIPTPCHENWQSMTPNEKGRHCMSCQKTVIDFTNMSDRQILEHITNASTTVCGRFNGDQLNKDLLVPSNKKRFSWAYIWNVAVVSFLFFGKAEAQAGHSIKKEIVADTLSLPVFGEVSFITRDALTCTIADSFTKRSIPEAKIRYKGNRHAIPRGADGNYYLIFYNGSYSMTLKVSAPGYESIEQVYRGNKKNLIIYLNPTQRKLKKEQELLSLEPKITCCHDDVLLAGMVMPRYKVTTTGKIIRSFTDTVFTPFKKYVKVFPNPVVRGSSINLSLSFKEAGEYKMELMDADGRVVLIQSLIMNAKQQIAQLETNPAWSAGTYWLRITGRNNKSFYQGKVLIQ